MIIDFVQGLGKQLTILRNFDHIVITNKNKSISMGSYSDLISSSKRI
jgi:hypothetical protein